jgi:hypothetical protein
MDNEPDSYPDFNPYSDAPPPPAPRRRLVSRLPRAAVAGGVAAVVALGAAGIAFAASNGSSTGSANPAAGSSSSSTTSPTTTPNKAPNGHGPGRFFRGGGFGGPGFGGFAGPGSIVHGTITTHTPSGYKTIEIQTGQVTSVSSSSITVKSSDGWTHTYVVTSKTVVDSQAGGISSVAAKDQVSLQATPQAGKDTAVNIVDITKVGSSRQSFGFGGPKPGGPSGPGAPAAPGGTGSGGSSGSKSGTSGFGGGGVQVQPQ